MTFRDLLAIAPAVDLPLRLEPHAAFLNVFTSAGMANRM